jgi:hypothetical protein
MFYTLFSSDCLRENSEIQDGCRGLMTTPFHKKIKKGFFSPSYISYFCYAREKSVIKSEFFTAWVSERTEVSI